MAVAVVHDEFTLGSGCGGVCATGEIIIGPLFGDAFLWAYNRFMVVDPTGPTFDVYEAVVPDNWRETSLAGGVPWNGGVAMVASASSAGGRRTYVVVVYPDATYDVFDTGVGWDTSAVVTVDASNRLVVVRSGSSAQPRVRNTDGTWSNLGFYAAGGAAHIVDGVLWTADANLVGTNITTNAVVATYSSLFTGAQGQSFIHDGRFWARNGPGLLLGVRLSDGDVRSFTVPASSSSALAFGAGKAWITSTNTTWSIDLTSGSVTTYPHPAPLGAIYNMFFTAGAAWAPGLSPTS